ncbi:related to protein tyrosine phosphatase-like protein PTPLA (contains Pro instead of catalytic Arg) [Rhynchosporium secalis]|uniref:Very-long-chain (3R)-3-hydroxyacyl-CoA dehydratase n=1 Tax=Rhynchosporium secalis TaxID=38038 RepID=A0A1E1M5K1_RHYSE|nr:related to protein tyrosine phosphatase-like protein PTPLA (contains Pro instead of catalytic Arg) [Rhynchosporium secalis]
MSLKNIYLLAYNIVSFLLWFSLTLLTITTLYRSLIIEPSPSQLLSIYYYLLPLLTATQSLAVLEVYHATCGLVRASPLTTAIQVGGKNLVVWTVMRKFPLLVANLENGGIWGFVGCVLAWGLSEMVRYGFFVVAIARGEAPAWLKWLRYSAFVVFYPPGFLSEAWLVYICLTKAVNIGAVYITYLGLGLMSYLPLGYILYTHMLIQRRKVLNPRTKST